MYHITGYFQFKDEDEWYHFNEEATRQVIFETDDYNQVHEMMTGLGIEHYLVTFIKVV